jgi:hypothetical protein
MAITIQFQGGKLAGKVISFDDHVETIKIGRNPGQCQVVFPPDETHVGREHFALQRVLGRYRVILNGEDRVFINGKEAYHEQELPDSADIRLGPQGPQIVATTSDASGLPPTIGRGKRQPGLGTELAGERLKSSRGLHVAVLALLVVATASVVGYQLHHETAEEVIDNGNLQRDTSNGLNETNEQLKQAIDELKKTAPDLAEHLQTAAPSVYLVLVKNPWGEFSDGTAWVIADGTLATNAHVAETFLSGLGPADKMIVRSCSNPPVDLEVTSVQIHPGYQRFDEVVVDREPSLVDTGGSRVPLNLVSACDVGLLKVSNGASLAPPLPMATDLEAQAMKSGDPVGMVGYPSENVTGHSTATPQPSVQSGRIARLTDFLLRTDGGAQTSQLVHHSIPETGGASGSPILNNDGLVVAINCGANFITINGTRIPTAVGLNFAQRVDVVRELVEQRADQAEKPREDQWNAELPNFSLLSDEDSVLAKAVDGWIAETPDSHAVEIGRTRLVLKTLYFGSHHFADYQVPVIAGGSYLFHIYSIGRSPVTFQLYTSLDATDSKQKDENMAFDEFEYTAPAAGTVRIALDSADEPATVDLVTYRLDTSPTTAPATAP